MKNVFRICAVTAVMMVLSSAALATYVETFDVDNAKWKMARYSSAMENPDWSATDGNSDGYIYKAIENSDRYITFQATDTYDSSGLLPVQWADMQVGETMTADFRIDGTVTAPSGNPMVRFYIGGPGSNYWMTNDAYSWNPNDDAEWTTHQVELVADKFVQMAGSNDFAYAVENLVDIGLQFGPYGEEFSYGNLGFTTDNGATVMLDNFGTIPEPATMALLGLGGLAFVCTKK